MPSDALTVAVTTGLGVSVLAGILSGICYILTHGLPNTRPRKAVTPWHCNVCGTQFRSIQGILEVEKVVTCAKCKARVCRVRCSKRDPQRGWICQVCQQPENWFKGLLKSIHPSKDWFNNRMDPDAIDELDEDLMELRKKEREQVRDFIERLVESMLGGNLDDVSVARLYNDKKYLPITGQTPCSAHTCLKQLIQRFSGEASELPTLQRSEDHPAHPEESLSDRTYEDLLSTAIINKVVQTVQTSQNEAAKSSANGSRTSTKGKQSVDDKEYFFGEETLDNKWRNNDSVHDDASSVSSMDDWVRSDSSLNSAKYVDRVSLTIKQHIEEGTSSDEEGRISPTQENSLLQPGDQSWQQNWYFQKRRLLDSSSPVPVPMLVPNPITEAKVLIGDKEAEELSDIDSDYGDPEVVPDIKNILVNSKTIIGGKNAIHTVDGTLNEYHPTDANGTEETEMDVDGGKPKTVVENFHVDTANVEAEDTAVANHEDLSFMSIESNTEQDTEYTEQYASLPRTFLKNVAPVPRARTKKHATDEEPKMTANGLKISDNEVNSASTKTIDTSDSSDEELRQQLGIFKGSYSEREKEKWKHPSVDIPDNPYSPENLERRISSRSSNGSNSSIFGRDYYVRSASRSTGTVKRPSSISNESEVIEYSPTLNGSEISSEVTATLATATPALIDTEESNGFESIGDSPISTNIQVLNDMSSDSDLSIERVYNLQSGKVFKKKGNVQQEIPIKDSYSPEGLKYVSREFDEDAMSTKTDENHNDSGVGSNKREFLRTLTQADEEYADIEQNKIEEGDVDVFDTVPYDDSKFKATLEKFKISEKGELQKIEKLEKVATLSEEQEMKIEKPEAITEIDASEVQKEPILECIIDSHMNSATIIEVPKYFDEINKADNKMNTSDYSEEDVVSENREFSLEYSTDINEDDISRTASSLEADPEIIDLKEKRLVKDLLGKFSNYLNVSTTPVKRVEEEILGTPDEKEDGLVLRKEICSSMENLQYSEVAYAETEEEPEEFEEQDTDHQSLHTEFQIHHSVKDLKQIFDKESTTSTPKKDPQQVYSLTARSLPRQIRQQLKSDDEISFQNEEHFADISMPNEEESDLVLPLDITRNRIAFYEELESKKKKL